MNNLYDLINIKNQDLDKAIKDVIKKVRFDLHDLDEEQTCMIYSSYVYYYLMDQNIMCYFINTKDDYGFDYEHYFVSVPYNGDYRYIIDLTYLQFGQDERFNDMYENGYMLLCKEDYHNYLERIAYVKSRR